MVHFQPRTHIQYWSVKSGKITKVFVIRIILVIVLVIVTKISLVICRLCDDFICDDTT